MNTLPENSIDVLVVAAHPDDAELSCGGTIAQLTSNGKTVVIVDCTLGELSSRGTIEQRAIETQKANEILKVSGRVNLLMEDGNIELSKDNILSLIRSIRQYRPKIILCNPPHERHPDHENVHKLVRTAVFQSGLTMIKTEFNGKHQLPHRPDKLFSYMQTYDFEPSFYVDISDYFQVKMESIRAYSSQVFVAGEHNTQQPQTFISKPAFMEMIEARARYFGALIGVEYAEAFHSHEPIGFSSFAHWL
ncbi:MAG: bacillithiol biosynthesis deacetylase BshB1 [Ignavibacteria bacterium]|nr:bacillithiol biosynthesis deacetylase BshB1 [Ignavibacteria bacterium]